MVYKYVKIETEIFDLIQINHTRFEDYKLLQDTINSDGDNKVIGQLIILPSY